MRLLSTSELVTVLRLYVEMYPDHQTAGGMFGFQFEHQLQVGNRERSPNSIARAAKLSCGGDILIGMKIARNLWGRRQPAAAES